MQRRLEWLLRKDDMHKSVSVLIFCPHEQHLRLRANPFLGHIFKTETGNTVGYYRCLRKKRPSKLCELIGFGVMGVTKPYRFIWFGDIHGPKPYYIMGLRWAFISQTPVVVSNRPAGLTDSMLNVARSRPKVVIQ